MFVEFAAGNTTPKRHAFAQCVDDEDVFELIPADAEHPLYNELYNNAQLWSNNSEVHCNKELVLLVKGPPEAASEGC